MIFPESACFGDPMTRRPDDPIFSVSPRLCGECCFLVAILVFLCSSVSLLAQQQNQEFESELQAGKSAAAQSDYLSAAKHFYRANELQQKKCSECYVWMARMELGAGRLPQALTQAEKAVATASTGPERASAQLYRGVVLGRQGNLGEAELAFKAAAAANPACVECKFNL